MFYQNDTISNISAPIDAKESPNIPIKGDMCSFSSGHKTLQTNSNTSLFGSDIQTKLNKNPSKMYGYNIQDFTGINRVNPNSNRAWTAPEMYYQPPSYMMQAQAPPQFQEPQQISQKMPPNTEFICGDVKTSGTGLFGKLSVAKKSKTSPTTSAPEFISTTTPGIYDNLAINIEPTTSSPSYIPTEYYTTPPSVEPTEYETRANIPSITSRSYEHVESESSQINTPTSGYIPTQTVSDMVAPTTMSVISQPITTTRVPEPPPMSAAATAAPVISTQMPQRQTIVPQFTQIPYAKYDQQTMAPIQSMGSKKGQSFTVDSGITGPGFGQSVQQPVQQYASVPNMIPSSFSPIGTGQSQGQGQGQGQGQDAFKPIDCQYTGWSNWTPCMRGSTRRTRMQTVYGPFFGGKPCMPQIETDDTTCPIDSTVTGWTDWTPCQTGSALRSRTQITIPPKNGGASIVPKTETDDTKCSADCQYTGWADWSPCVPGSAVRTRIQTYTNPKNNGKPCNPQIETDPSTCSVDSTITGWSEWSQCVPGSNARSRTEITVPAVNRGATFKPKTEVDISTCPVNSTVMGWSDWSQCDAVSATRTRHEITLPPFNGGQPVFPKTEVDTTTCSLDCQYTFDTSSTICDPETETKVYKVATYKPAANNGRPCTYGGNTITAVGQIVSSTDVCIENTQVTGWTEWSRCEPGKETRTRTQLTRPGTIHGTRMTPQVEIDSSTCPTNCQFSLDFDNNTSTGCDTSSNTRIYKVTYYKPAINDGSACVYQGTTITQKDQIIPSIDDCSVNCIGSYSGYDYCDISSAGGVGDYYRIYNVVSTSINQGGKCSIKDGSYNISFTAPKVGNRYGVKVGTCSDCKYDISPIGCDLATNYQKFKVTSYVPEKNGGQGCSYNGIPITKLNQEFTSNSPSDVCQSECDVSFVSDWCDSSAGLYYRTYNVNRESKYKDTCTYKDPSFGNISLNNRLGSQRVYVDRCNNCSFSQVLYDSKNHRKRYNVNTYMAAKNSRVDCSYNGTIITGTGLYQSNDQADPCSYGEWTDDGTTEVTGCKLMKKRQSRTQTNNGMDDCVTSYNWVKDVSSTDTSLCPSCTYSDWQTKRTTVTGCKKVNIYQERNVYDHGKGDCGESSHTWYNQESSDTSQCPSCTYGQWETTGTTLTGCNKMIVYQKRTTTDHGKGDCGESSRILYDQYTENDSLCPRDCEGHWECSRKCGGGKITGFVVTKNEVNGGQCPNRNQTRRGEDCNTQPCIVTESTDMWGSSIGDYKTISCKDNKYVTSFLGYTDAWMDSIGINCQDKDGNSNNEGLLHGWAGGGKPQYYKGCYGGKDNTMTGVTLYKINAWDGVHAAGIHPICKYNQSNTEDYGVTSTGGHGTVTGETYMCPSGYSVSGLKSYGHKYVDSLGIYCKEDE